VTAHAPEPTLVREQQARLVRLATMILSPVLGHRRPVVARVAVEQALRRIPGPRGAGDYSRLRTIVVRRALATGNRRPGPSTTVRGLRAVRPDAPADELTWLLPAARAAYALHHLEGLDEAATQQVLADAGVGDPESATALADAIVGQPPMSLGAAPLR
jgi:hypothetical protein